MSTVDTGLLRELAGAENVRDGETDLYVYGIDASVHSARPSAVVKPDTAEHVKKILEYAQSEKVPVIPRGSGSAMCGQTIPINGGIVLDMKGMNRILEINIRDGYCRVEPGVVDEDLNLALKEYGFFYPPAPASSRVATIGGEIGNNASGVRSVKYGAARDYILGLNAVLPGGEELRCGTRTRVVSSGYQLERLFVGSEGTLGIITEATLKFIPTPRFRCLGISNFLKLEEAGEAVADIISSGSNPSMLELIDNVAIQAVNEATGLGLPDVEAILLFEADGMVKEGVEYEIRNIEKYCEKNGGFGIESSYDQTERSRLFAGRKQLFPSLAKYRSVLSTTALADDMAVPFSKMAETTRKIHDVAAKHNVIMTAYGHCGSGCVHTKILMDTSKKEVWEAAKKVVAEIYEYVQSVGGTTSAEHGIGISKGFAMQQEHRDLLTVMRGIKKVFDPDNICNPMKLMDAPDDWLGATDLRYSVTR
jgi:glycolate oxidase